LFFNHWYRHYGLPRKIVSVRDGRFVGKFWQELFRLTQVRLAMSSSHHPQTDGQTERTNRTMEETLRHYVNYRPNNRDEVLPAFEHAYNNSVNATTRQVPFELLYGQKPLEFKDFLLPSSTTTVESVTDFVSRMESLVADASKSIAQANQTAGHHSNRKRMGHVFGVGDKVLLSTKHFTPPIPSSAVKPA
jgi:hypothetical protein